MAYSHVVSGELLVDFCARLLCPGDFLGKNARLGSHALLQGMVQTQRLNLGLLHCRQILYHLSHQGRPVYALRFI